ncbi:MAG: hypothetical protein OZ948_11370 [Deltaproteobacteria bacterium]|nr:hypothetical protein [Deltaproteobacteria bacterium]
MACRKPGSIQSVPRSSFLALLALALGAAPVVADAAHLSQVRVGTHEDHTRIVLELDAEASYRLTPPGAGGSQLQIQLAADSAARHVASKSPLVKGVRVEPSQQGSTISVDLTRSNVEISEMVLANPPRIVLDLKQAGAATAMAPPAVPAAKPAPAAPTAPEPIAARAPAPPTAPATAPASESAAASAPPAPSSTPSAPGRLSADGRPVVEGKPVAPAPKAGAPSLSDPVPSDIAGKPSARFEPPPPPAPAASAKVERIERPASVNPEIAARSEAKPELAPATPPVSPAAPAAAGEARVEPPAPAPPPAAKPAEVVVRNAAPRDPEPPAPAARSWADRLTSPTGYAVIGGVLLALVVLAVRRRRREEDDDPLYSVMSADDAGADADDQDLRGQQEEPAVGWGQREESEPEAAYDPAGFDADEPVARDGSQQLALGRIQADPAPAADEDSLFDGPGAPAIATPPPAPVISSAYASDASQVAGELESRMKDMERRIEQLAEARERLERQVAAQTEELRVQRAAIARTQRVVRSMTKGEDLATEPVPRAPQA